jgi:hypothetical protein
MARLSAVEARLEIGQLPIGYARAVDSRDVDGWAWLFEPEVGDRVIVMSSEE